jgi:hypothetical protein
MCLLQITCFIINSTMPIKHYIKNTSKKIQIIVKQEIRYRNVLFYRFLMLLSQLQLQDFVIKLVFVPLKRKYIGKVQSGKTRNSLMEV